MNLETKITIYKFTPQVFTLTLYHLARFSLASSGPDFLLKMSVSFMLRLYPSGSLYLVFCQ